MKKIICASLASVLCMFMFTGCFSSLYGSGNQKQLPAERYIGKGDITITVGGLHLDYIHEFIEMAQKKMSDEYPGVKVHFKGVEMDFDNLEAINENLWAAFEAGTAPDIIVADYIPVEKYAQTGYLLDMYQFLDNDEKISENSYHSNVLKAWEYDGELVQISPLMAYSIVMVNKDYADLIENELAEIDSMNYKTMIELFDLVKQRYDGEKELHPAKAFYPRYILEMEKSAFYNEAEKYVNFDDRVLELLTDVEDYSLGDLYVYPDALDEYEDDQFVFSFGYTPSLASFFPESESLMPVTGFFPYEDLDGNFKFNGYGTSFAINASCENPELAWALLREMTTDVNLKSGKVVSDFLPARKDEFFTNYRSNLMGNIVKDKKRGVSEEELDERMAKIDKHHQRLNICEAYNPRFVTLLIELVEPYEKGEISKEEFVESLQTRMTELANS